MAKGISLHVGVNECNRNVYLKKYGKEPNYLPNCCNDAKACMDKAKRFGFTPTHLLDKAATASALLDGIRYISKLLHRGDLFFLTFSGHGGQVLDRDGDEQRHQYAGYVPDLIDETWCLYDRMVIDDELFAAFAQFRQGVRLLVISDSCHSGTCTKNTIPDDKDIAATGLLMAACQDEQVAITGSSQEKYSRYTQALLRVLEQGGPCNNYQVLHDRISSQMPNKSKPNLFPFGQNGDRFIQSKPFAI
jgi:metacaspase-1